MDEKLATAPVAKLARPWEFGPISRNPRARARAAISRSCALPLAVSPNPDAIIMAIFTPAAAQASTAATAAAPGIAMIATSGVSGRAPRFGKLLRPCSSTRFGLIGNTRPRKPKRAR